MKTILFLSLLLPVFAHASIVGITTHPLNDEARVLSAEMTGYMSQRNEMGAGLRYTQEIAQDKLLDVTAAGGQNSRGLVLGTGMDFEIFSEDVNQPRVSIKPYLQYQKFEGTTSNLLGAAPTIRKGFGIKGQEIFPYFAIPTGIKIDNANDEFAYYSSLTFGTSMPFPGGSNEKVLLSIEGNMDMGSSSDYIGFLVSWIWK